MKQSGESLEMQNKCAEIKIRAERRAGELLKDGQENGEIEKQGGDRKSKLHDETLIDNKPISLDEAGLSRIESHRFQALADLGFGSQREGFAHARIIRIGVTMAGFNFRGIFASEGDAGLHCARGGIVVSV